MGWYLNRALTNFKDAVDTAYPDRDKGSDGTIGDEAHQARTSDHNPDGDGSVDAWDMDVEVNGPGKPYAKDIEQLKQVFERHEASAYWIHNDQIAFRDEGWRPRSYAYAGPQRNRHTKHVHWNTRESHEDSNAPWIITMEDIVASLDDLRELIREEVGPAVLLRDGMVKAPWPSRKDANDKWQAANVISHGAGHSIEANTKMTAALVKLDNLTEMVATAIQRGDGNFDAAAVLSRLDGLANQVAELTAELTAANAKLAEAEAERERLLAELAAARRAEADALAKTAS